MTKDTINEILQTSGLYSVVGPQDIPSIEAALGKLASAIVALGPVGRTLIAEAATKHLRSIGIERASTLVNATLKPNSKTSAKPQQPSASELPSVEHVDGSTLASELHDVIERYIWLPEWAVIKLMLFVVYTYAFDCFDTSPLLVITSAEPESGKSRVLDVLAYLVQKPWRVTASSTAVLFRYVSAEHPTVLFDEFDNVDVAARKDLIAVVNAGHSRSGAFVPRCVGDNYEPTMFDVFAPKAVAGIGQFLPATTWSRAIVIEMKTQPTSDLSAKLVQAEVDTTFRELRSRIQRWVRDHIREMASTRPFIPAGLGDRETDSWTPLFAIADLLGAPWNELARRAALESTDGRFAEVSEGRLLLSHIREVVRDRDGDRITSRELVDALRADEDWPWKERGRKGLTPIELAKLIRRYGVRPNPLHFKHAPNAKGYYFKDLFRAFANYLRNIPESLSLETDEDAPGAGDVGDTGDVTGITGTIPPSGTDDGGPSK
jgi:hypothetical protein